MAATVLRLPRRALRCAEHGSLWQRGAEAVVALKPDLVLSAGITSDADVKTLSDLGLTVYKGRNAYEPPRPHADILALGQLNMHH